MAEQYYVCRSTLRVAHMYFCRECRENHLQVYKANWWHITEPQRIELVTELESVNDDPLWLLAKAYPASEWEACDSISEALDVIADAFSERIEVISSREVVYV